MRQTVTLLIAFAVVVAIGVTYTQRMRKPAPQPDVIEGPDGWLYPGWDRLVDDHRSEARDGVRMVAEVNRRLQAQGARLVVMLIPNKARIVPEHYPADRRAQVQQSRAYDDLVGRLRGQGLTVVDAEPALLALKASGGETYFHRDAHWTGVAAEAVAGALAKAITATGPAPGPAGQGEKIAPWRIVRRYPDLVEIQRHKGDLRYGEEDYQLRDYVTPPTGPAPILIVGSSFADRQYGVPEKLSQLLDRRVAILIRFGADGCWQAMAEHLKAPPDLATKVVVWHLGEGSFSSGQAQAAMSAYLKAS